MPRVSASASIWRLRALAAALNRFLVPLAFAVFPFTFALQVATRSETVGLVPYVLIAASIVLTLAGTRPFLPAPPASVVGKVVDLLVIVLVASCVLHTCASLVLQVIDVSEAARLLLIYGFSGWVYVHVSRYADRGEHVNIMLAVVLSSAIVAAHWCYDTYAKMILGRTSVFQQMMFEYVKVRNGFDDNDVNVSLLRPEYRAYGLLDKHTTSGGVVGIGGFATLSLFSQSSLNMRMLAMLMYFVSLTVGMATLAWLSFVLLLPLGLLLAEREKSAGVVLMRLAVFFVLLSASLGIVAQMSDHPMRLFQTIWDLFATQASFVANLDGNSARVSWLGLYINEIKAYVSYISANPLCAIFGEGFAGYGSLLPRGGDAAFFEFLATFGIPLALFILSAILLATISAIRAILSRRVSRYEAGNLAFAAMCLLFMLMSLAHYNTFFNKAVYVFLFLALALVRRYVPAVRPVGPATQPR